MNSGWLLKVNQNFRLEVSMSRFVSNSVPVNDKEKIVTVFNSYAVVGFDYDRKLLEEKGQLQLWGTSIEADEDLDFGDEQFESDSPTAQPQADGSANAGEAASAEGGQLGGEENGEPITPASPETDEVDLRSQVDESLEWHSDDFEKPAAIRLKDVPKPSDYEDEEDWDDALMDALSNDGEDGIGQLLIDISPFIQEPLTALAMWRTGDDEPTASVWSVQPNADKVVYLFDGC